MPLTLDTLAALAETSAPARAWCAQLGVTPAQAAYLFLESVAAEPSDRVRDTMIGNLFFECGVYGVNNAADADAFFDELTERNTGQLARVEPRPFAPKFDREQQLDFFARQSHTTPVAWTRRDIERLANVSTRAAVTAGVSSRMRDRDHARYGRDLTPLDPQFKASAQDARSRRDMLERAYLARAPAARAPDYADKRREEFSMRDAVENAFDREWVTAEMAEAEADPLEAAREAVNGA